MNGIDLKTYFVDITHYIKSFAFITTEQVGGGGGLVYSVTCVESEKKSA